MDDKIRNENTEGGETRRMPPIKKSDFEDTLRIPVNFDDESETVATEEKIIEKAEEIYEEPSQKEEYDDNAPRKWVPIFASSVIAAVMCISILATHIVPILYARGWAKGMVDIISPMVNVAEPPKETNILLVGTDRGGYRTDTMMVATYDHNNNAVHVMQLPRDTYVSGNGRRDKKLNSAYFSGVEQLEHELELAYGIKVQRYLAVELDGFIEIVDKLGGVEVNVPIDMDYDDPTKGQNLHIHLKKGIQTLDGEKAEGFVRFRKNNDGSGYPLGDIDRMAAQKDFIMAVIKKIVSMDGISKIPELIDIVKENIETNISMDEAYSYIYKVLSLDSENINFYNAAGKMAYSSGWYFFVDKDENDIMVDEYFYGDKYVSKIYASKPAVQIPSAETSSSDIDDDERYTYYTSPSPEPSESPELSASPNPSETPNPDESPDPNETPGPDATPDSSASPKPSATPKSSAKPGEVADTPKPEEETADKTAKPAKTPKPTPEAEDESENLTEKEEVENITEETEEE